MSYYPLVFMFFKKNTFCKKINLAGKVQIQMDLQGKQKIDKKLLFFYNSRCKWVDLYPILEQVPNEFKNTLIRSHYRLRSQQYFFPEKGTIVNSNCLLIYTNGEKGTKLKDKETTWMHLLFYKSQLFDLREFKSLLFWQLNHNRQYNCFNLLIYFLY